MLACTHCLYDDLILYSHCLHDDLALCSSCLPPPPPRSSSCLRASTASTTTAGPSMSPRRERRTRAAVWSARRAGSQCCSTGESKALLLCAAPGVASRVKIRIIIYRERASRVSSHIKISRHRSAIEVRDGMKNRIGDQVDLQVRRCKLPASTRGRDLLR